MIAGMIALILVIVILLYLFLIMPNVSHPADMDALCTGYAHRGLWDAKIPENSLAAFSRAVQAGYGIELDVQLSKDRQVMVFHDASLKRMCGVNRRVCDLTCAELKAMALKGTGQTIPTLSEVLALVKGRVPLMIEVKGETVQKALCVRIARMLDSYEGAFCIISFSPLILNWFKNYRPCYARGQLVTKVTNHQRKGSCFANFFLTHMLLNFLSRPDFISINQKYRKRLSMLLCTRVFHRVGFAWTVGSKKEYGECRRQGLFPVFEGIHPPRIRQKGE